MPKFYGKAFVISGTVQQNTRSIYKWRKRYASKHEMSTEIDKDVDLPVRQSQLPLNGPFFHFIFYSIGGPLWSNQNLIRFCLGLSYHFSLYSIKTLIWSWQEKNFDCVTINDNEFGEWFYFFLIVTIKMSLAQSLRVSYYFIQSRLLLG